MKSFLLQGKIINFVKEGNSFRHQTYLVVLSGEKKIVLNREVLEEAALKILDNETREISSDRLMLDVLKGKQLAVIIAK